MVKWQRLFIFEQVKTDLSSSEKSTFEVWIACKVPTLITYLVHNIFITKKYECELAFGDGQNNEISFFLCIFFSLHYNIQKFRLLITNQYHALCLFSTFLSRHVSLAHCYLLPMYVAHSFTSQLLCPFSISCSFGQLSRWWCLCCKINNLCFFSLFFLFTCVLFSPFFWLWAMKIKTTLSMYCICKTV